MYKALCDGALMFDSRIEELALIHPVLNLEENKAGSFTFKISPDHPKYDDIQRRKTIVEVYQDDEDEPRFIGMCIEAEEDFYKQKKIYCEGALSFLNDSVQRPFRYQGYTVRGLLEAFIANHNSQVEEVKHFRVGIVTVSDPNNYISCYTNMESTMKCIKEDLVDDLGGIIRIRCDNGVRYIDYLAESPNTNSQVIKFGKNLMDFTKNIDSSEIATAIIPLGAKLEQSTVEGLETRLTIESVNNGIDYVHSPEAVKEYGWICKTVEFDDVTTASALKSKGEKYLAETQFEKMVIEAKAVDLHLTDVNIEKFKISDQIRVKSTPHGLNKYFRLTKLTLNLDNPKNDKITLGKNERVTLSAKTNQANEEIKKAIANIVPPNTILNDAIANATQLITAAMGGYVVKTNDELLIMDTDNTETATKVWRWNINGLGYSSTGYKGEYALAMTMDGKIVADFIATGSMYADRIKGGTLKLGGNNNENGILLIVDKDGNTVGRWDKDGIVLPEGTSIAWKDIKDIPSDIVDMQIGGTNLLKNTKDFTSNWWGNNTNLGAMEDPFGGMDAYAFKGTADGNSYLIQSGVVKRSGKYVASLWAKASNPYEIYIGCQTFRVAKLSLTTDWQRFEVPFEATITSAEWWCFGSYGTWNDTETEICLYHPKLEEGTIGTDWSPSPSDTVAKGEVSAQISAENGDINIRANRLSWEADNSTLTKDGTLTARNAVVNGGKLVNSGEYGELRLEGQGITIESKVPGSTTSFSMYDLATEKFAELSQVGLKMWDYNPTDYRDQNIVNLPMDRSKDGYISCAMLHIQALSVSGTKSRVSTTENYNERLLYCYEMPTPYFGDIGEGQLDESGICYVYIDDIFIETIDTSCNYQVFLQKYGEGDLVVTERNQGYFVVKGTPNLSFAWELKAKQSGYTMQRLEELNRTTNEEDETNYEAEANVYLTNYEKEILNYA